ncbi:hypothetical protein ES703_102864 [subsurface metagenome]
MTEHKYDISEFRISAQDKKGHSARRWFRLQPGHDSMIDEIVAKRIFPYRTASDLIRHAVKRHLDWLETLEPIPSITKQVDIILDLMRQEEFQRDFQTVMDKLREQAWAYQRNGSQGEAERLINDTYQKILAMPIGYWRERYLEQLRKEFGPMVKPFNMAKRKK